jgi:hypothetical protein
VIAARTSFVYNHAHSFQRPGRPIITAARAAVTPGVTRPERACPTGGIVMSAPYHAGSAAKAKAEPYQGIGGWLLVFIISAIFLYPLLTAFSALVSLVFAARVSSVFPLITLLTLVDIGCSMLVTGFGIVAGIFLWTKNSRASGLARIYLFTRAFYTFFMLFVVGLSMSVSDLPPVIKDALPRWIIVSSLPSIAYVMIWIGYFKKSKRVKATYGDPQDDYLTLDLTR